MSNETYFKPSPSYYFQRFVETLKTLSIVFILTFVISSIYLLHKNILFESIKISLSYFRAKFYMAIGFKNSAVPIFDIPKLDAPPAIWVINNDRIIKIYGYLKDAIFNSIITSFTWAIYVVIGLACLFAIKTFWKHKKKAIINSRPVRNLLLKLQTAINNNLNSVLSHPIKIVPQQNQYSSPIPEEKTFIVVKPKTHEINPNTKPQKTKKSDNDLTGNFY